MEIIEAKILLRNLLKRIRKVEEDSYELTGRLTDDELMSLKMALGSLNRSNNHLSSPVNELPLETEKNVSFIEKTASKIELDTSVLQLESASNDFRLCLDFGTAMSKATLVEDEMEEQNYEEIKVLKLGVPSDQEEISGTMLISSVFIDTDGKLWFGKKAIDYSNLESQDGNRQRLDNIKRYLSEEGLTETVGSQFNPTPIKITYEDMVLAYLTFLTWAVKHSLGEAYPRNINRRFAMPCFTNKEKSRNAKQLLKKMLGEAQILADTFDNNIFEGLYLSDFMSAISQLKEIKVDYNFIQNAITEPLGVAGSLLSWKDSVNTLIMVIDIGAGTSDFSLYRLAYNPNTGESTALEVKDSMRGFTEAGNHLDKLLKGLILKKGKITSSDTHWINIQGMLELNLRDYKESLFRDGFISVSLHSGEEVDIELDEFLSLDQVQKFSESLKDCMFDILNNIDSSFIKGAPNNALAVMLTGGGAELPMAKDLASGDIKINDVSIKRVQPKSFPTWLSLDYPELESDYPRIAVSLGGARKRIIKSGRKVNITAGDITTPPILEGFYTKGS